MRWRSLRRCCWLAAGGLHDIATSLPVGHANIFPVTAAGKAIGAAVMMIGPALSARALEPAGA